MAERLEISEVVRMIQECAPDATLRVASHWIIVKRGDVAEAIPKGEGKPKKPEQARGEVYARVVLKVARSLGLSASCVNRRFPGLIDAETRSVDGAGERR